MKRLKKADKSGTRAKDLKENKVGYAGKIYQCAV